MLVEGVTNHFLIQQMQRPELLKGSDYYFRKYYVIIAVTVIAVTIYFVSAMTTFVTVMT